MSVEKSGIRARLRVLRDVAFVAATLPFFNSDRETIPRDFFAFTDSVMHEVLTVTPPTGKGITVRAEFDDGEDVNSRQFFSFEDLEGPKPQYGGATRLLMTYSMAQATLFGFSKNEVLKYDVDGGDPTKLSNGEIAEVQTKMARAFDAWRKGSRGKR